MDLLLLLFTIGYLLQFIGQLFILLHIRKSQSTDGLQRDTQLIMMVANIIRIFWFLDTSLYEIPWVFVEIVLSIVLQGYLLYQFHRLKDSQYVQMSSPLGVYRLVPVCLVLSVFINPGDTWLSWEILIAFSFFLESVAVLPQIHLMRKVGTVDVKIGKYLLFIAASRAVRIIFWIQYYLSGEMFFSLLFADVIHTLLLADFVWIYFKNQGRGNMIII